MGNSCTVCVCAIRWFVIYWWCPFTPQHLRWLPFQPQLKQVYSTTTRASLLGCTVARPIITEGEESSADTELISPPSSWKSWKKPSRRRDIQMSSWERNWQWKSISLKLEFRYNITVVSVFTASSQLFIVVITPIVACASNEIMWKIIKSEVWVVYTVAVDTALFH